MFRDTLKYFFIIILFTITSCAKRGTITGGKKDTIAPVLKSSFPKNNSIKFVGNKIILNFDEYVKLKNVDKQLIVSPPLKYKSEIFPSTPSKEITIKIKDTLQPNTTYSFNFGQSIEDNNEANPYKQFKYVFSTGNYLDSLSIAGKIKDALNQKEDHFVTVMLYEANNKLKDSAVYKEIPRYLTNTLDSLKFFKIDNIKPGKYSLLALKDKNGNNKFDPKEDKIGFQKQYITIPNDTVFQLELFKEKLPFKALKPKQTSGNQILLPFEGDYRNTKVILKNGETILPTIVTKFDKKDSLQVWYKPIKSDSLKLIVTREKFLENFKFKIKDQKKDTLSFIPSHTNEIDFRTTFSIRSSVPITKFDKTKMKLTQKDSKLVDFEPIYDDINQELKINFKKDPSEKYAFLAIPGAILDYLDRKSDSIKFKFNTSKTTDFGNLKVVLEKVNRFPVIVEILNSSGKIVAVEFSDKKTTIEFNLIEPEKYTLRLIYDDNKNKEWDSGSYLKKLQAEEVIYFPKVIDVRANWDVEQSFDLSK
jgi:Bacterial Ig-like domain